MKRFSGETSLLGSGLPRRWEGAVIGILFVVSFGCLFWEIGYMPLAVAFLFPGCLVSMLVEPHEIFFWLSDPLAALRISGVSLIPPAIIGALIVSKRMIQRTFGMILLVIYILLWIVFSFYLARVLTKVS